MAVGDVYECILRWENIRNNDGYINVLHFLCNTDAVGISNERSICDPVNAFINMNILPNLNDKFRFRGVVVQRVFPLPRTTGYYQFNGDANTGGTIDDALPPSCAMVVRKRTEFAGRKYRGRVYQVGMSEGDQDNGVWSGIGYNSLVIQWDSLLTTLLVGGGGGEFSPCIWPHNGVASGDATVVTSTFTDNIVRSQRRREPGKGS